MEINFKKIILLVFLVWGIFVLISGLIRRKKHTSRILSLSKEEQKEYQEKILRFIKSVKFIIYSLPIASIVFLLLLRIYEPDDFYLFIALLVTSYLIMLDTYLYYKRISVMLSQTISQNDP